MTINETKVRFFAEIVRDIASVFLGPLLAGGASPFLIIAGLVLALVCWSVSILLIR